MFSIRMPTFFLWYNLQFKCVCVQVRFAAAARYDWDYRHCRAAVYRRNYQ